MDKLGKYEIIKEIGRGGFATVYQARDVELNRLIALKILHSQLTVDPTFIQRFHQEAQAAAGLHHPHIVTIYEVGEEAGYHYLAMAYLPGHPLSKLIAAGPVPIEQALTIIEQIASALDAVHSRGLVHRDVKPANIMIGPEEQATLLDFGIVRAAEGTRLTTSTAILGTPEYLAPEQVELEPGLELDWRADIYALGIVAYELLAGQPPFTGKSPTGILYKHVHETPPAPLSLNPHLPPEFEAPLLKAIAKPREQRFQQAGDFAAALRRAQQTREQDRQLIPLYERLQAAIGHKDWPTALNLIGQIEAKNPNFRDVPALHRHVHRQLRPPAAKPTRPAWLWPAIGGGAILLLLVCLGGSFLLLQAIAPAPSSPTSIVQAPFATPSPLPPTPAPTATFTPEPQPTKTPPATPTSTPTPLPTATPTKQAPARKTPPGSTAQEITLPSPSPTATPADEWIVFQSKRNNIFNVYAKDPNNIDDEVCLTCNSISGGSPALSPDGTRLAFVSTEGDMFQLYLLDLKSQKVTNLIPDSANYFQPAWSPDGTRLAFASDREIDKYSYEICFINVKEALQGIISGNLVCLTRHPAEDRAPAWSPDGKHIAFSSNRDTNSDDTFDIFLMNTDGSEQTRLLKDFSGSGWPAWSPDGTHLAFHSKQSGNGEIYIVNADGSGLFNLTNHPANEQHPTWSPDGTRLAFDSDRDGNLEIYLINVKDNHQLTNLTKNPDADDQTPSWGLK